MRLTTITIFTATFAVAAAASYVAAGFAVTGVESQSETSVQAGLEGAGLTWASVDADGLQVILSGTAPTESQRFKARSIAGGVVEASRVVDHMQVQAQADLAPPAFSVEILRNGDTISLIGLVPTGMDREEMVKRIGRLAGVKTVSDFLQTADYALPDAWTNSIGFAVTALKDLPNSKISIAPGKVTVIAMSSSAEQRSALETRLQNEASSDISLDLQISAPRPVIAPFTLRYVIDGKGARFVSCAADTVEARDQILAAARETGLKAEADCVIGLGVPASSWGNVAAMSIRALGQLGAGTVTLSDADISLIAAEGTKQATFDKVVGTLENSLPDVFTLHAQLPKMPDQIASTAPEFGATLDKDGVVQLHGRVSDEIMRNAAQSLAEARFGASKVQSSARLDDSLPETWPVRVLTALDALSHLKTGSVTVTADTVKITGDTGTKTASADIAQLFAAKLGEGAKYDIDVTYRKGLDPVASKPTAARCLARLQGLQKDNKISFEPGSANIDAASRDLLDQVADVLKQCPRLPLLIAGYTDSQGREEMNQQLSEGRARAVLSELQMRRVLTGTFEAKGFGEADPIADNSTEEGREANRRIEFRLTAPDGPPLQTQPDTAAGESAGADNN